MTYFHPRNPRT